LLSDLMKPNLTILLVSIISFLNLADQNPCRTNR
jgi:hypothetical protein